MRKLVILCLMVGMLLIGGVVSAQDTPPVFCGTLAQADCTILQQSRTAMADLKSADVNLTFNISAANVPNMPTTEPLNISLTGTGSFSGDVSSIGPMPMGTTDPAASIAYLSKALAAINAKLNLTITIPPAITQMAAAGSNPVTIPNSIPINLVLVDGKGYVDFDSLGPVIAALDTSGSSASSMPKGWVGLDLVAALTQMGPMMTQMASMATEEAAASDAMAQFTDPTFLAKYIKVERGTDATVNGDAVAVFNTTVDVAGLLADPAVQAEIQKQAAATGSQQAEGSVAMLSQFGSSLSMTATTEIGTADNIVRGASADITFDATSMMAMMQASSDSTPEATAPQAAPVVKIHFDYALSNINSATAVTAPDGAVVVPLSSLMGGNDSSAGMDTDMSGLDTDMSGLDSMMQGMDTLVATPAS